MCVTVMLYRLCVSIHKAGSPPLARIFSLHIYTIVFCCPRCFLSTTRSPFLSGGKMGIDSTRAKTPALAATACPHALRTPHELKQCAAHRVYRFMSSAVRFPLCANVYARCNGRTRLNTGGKTSIGSTRAKTPALAALAATACPHALRTPHELEQCAAYRVYRFMPSAVCFPLCANVYARCNGRTRLNTGGKMGIDSPCAKTPALAAPAATACPHALRTPHELKQCAAHRVYRFMSSAVRSPLNIPRGHRHPFPLYSPLRLCVEPPEYSLLKIRTVFYGQAKPSNHLHRRRAPTLHPSARYI